MAEKNDLTDLTNVTTFLQSTGAQIGVSVAVVALIIVAVVAAITGAF